MSKKKPKPTAVPASESLALPISRASSAKCAAQHFGAWSIEPRWFKSAIDAIRAGTWKPEEPKADYDDDEEDGGPAYQVHSGVAVIAIDGQMTKRGSSWGGCSTVEVRQQVRAAADDWMVNAILLHICSPGGTVSGTADLAADVKAARQKKPVHAYIADMGCSAAYWVASQCETIRANVTAVVGSIGTYTVLEDDTKYAEDIGIKYRIVSTGEYKGLGADGAVTDKLVADVQREVDELNAPFLAAVAEGRGGKIADVKAIADGRAHVGEQAKQLGLIDSIASLDAAIEAISSRSKPMTPTDQVKQIAAEHPEAVSAFIEQGYNQAKKDLTPKAATVGQLEEAFPGQDAFVLAQLKAGATMEQANAAATKTLRADAAATVTKHTEALAAKDAKITELSAEVERLKFSLDGQRGVTTTGVKKEEPKAGATDHSKIEDPKERAKAEYAADFNGCRNAFVNESAYVGFRCVELRNGVTIHKPAAPAA